jgi:hypothetical protein
MFQSGNTNSPVSNKAPTIIKILAFFIILFL